MRIRRPNTRPSRYRGPRRAELRRYTWLDKVAAYEDGFDQALAAAHYGNQRRIDEAYVKGLVAGAEIVTEVTDDESEVYQRGRLAGAADAVRFLEELDQLGQETSR